MARAGRFTIWASRVPTPARAIQGIVPLTQPSVAEQPQEVYLPRPPHRREKYGYFGKQRRWVFAWLLIASAGLTGTSMWPSGAWAVSPFMWLLLMVMAPTVVNFWLRNRHRG